MGYRTWHGFPVRTEAQMPRDLIACLSPKPDPNSGRPTNVIQVAVAGRPTNVIQVAGVRTRRST